MEYFKYIPKTEYGDDLVTNVMARGKVREFIKNNVDVFYEYLIQDGQKPEFVADFYYGGVKFVWLLFYANDIFDPLYDWPLDSNDFPRYVQQKYRSGEIILTNNNNLVFMADDKTISSTDESTIERMKNIPIGSYIDIVAINNQGLYHVINTTEEDGTFSLVLREQPKASGSEAIVITDPIVDETGNITTIEIAQPETIIHHYEDTEGDTVDYDTWLEELSGKRVVSQYDYEFELNEEKRSIIIIDSRYLGRILSEMRTLFDTPV